jgi:arylsulfatase A-like enzyme
MFRLLFALLGSGLATAGSAAERPNIILILADDLGYGELGSYGQRLIQTPRLDQMATEGMRFTQFYAGSTVCAPSRSVLLTGQHLGHTRVRGNAGPDRPFAQTLRAGDATVARSLQQAGYRTSLIGKWGLGLIDEEGEPRLQGFDTYFGFLSQTHAHNHFPDHLWRDGQRVPLKNDLVPMGRVAGVGYATRPLQYAGDLFAEEALRFIAEHEDKPFFMYLSVIVPHANNERAEALGDGHEVPDYGPYEDKPWPDTAKGHAAMITRLDTQVGGLLDELRRRGLAEKTLVLFSSDNGPHQEGGPSYDPGFFEVCGGLTGLKRSLTEGGIRVPLLAWWPGRIPAGRVNRHVGYFGDFFATFAELAGAPLPAGRDSISLVPTLLGRGGQRDHDYLYWEFYENGVSQAVLLEGRWKGIRLRSPAAPLQLYDLENDLAEQRDVAAEHPGLVERLVRIMREAHQPNEYWGIDFAADAAAR